MSSCAACAVHAAPPSADRRHPQVQLRCCSAYCRASSLEPTRRQRARRAASTSFLDRAAVDLVDVRRSCRRAPRAPSRPHRRAPTDVILTFSFVAALPIAAPAHSSRHDDSERAEPRARRSLIAPPISSTNADRVVVRRVRPPGRTAGRRPTSSSRSASLLLFHRRASSLEPPRRQRARAEPRARRALIARRRPRRANTDRVASGAACAVLAFHHRVYLPNRISLAEVHSDVRARRYVKSVADVQRGNRSGLIGSSRFPLRSAPLRSAPLRSALLRFAPLRFALPASLWIASSCRS